MKLASLPNGTRDGALVVVSKDLSICVSAQAIAPTLQAALDEWDNTAPRLRDLADRLSQGDAPGAQAFESGKALSPLPRAFQWADGSAYVNHVALVRQARGADMPASFWTDPLMYQGGSDGFLAPCAPIPLADPAWGCDFEAEIAVITGDVAQGCSLAEAEAAIRLVLLVNDVSLRNLIPGELGKGFGFFQSKPASAFSPVAVTPQELGLHWRDGKLHLPLRTSLNGTLYGRPEAGIDMTFSFPQLIAHAAKPAIWRRAALSARAPSQIAARMADPARRSAKAGSAIPVWRSSASWKRSALARRARRFCRPATACGSRCWRRTGKACLARLTKWWRGRATDRRAHEPVAIFLLALVGGLSGADRAEFERR